MNLSALCFVLYFVLLHWWLQKLIYIPALPRHFTGEALSSSYQLSIMRFKIIWRLQARQCYVLHYQYTHRLVLHLAHNIHIGLSFMLKDEYLYQQYRNQYHKKEKKTEKGSSVFIIFLSVLIIARVTKIISSLGQ